MTTEMKVLEAKHEYRLVVVGAIVPCRFQSRFFSAEPDDALKALADSIACDGIIEALVVRELEDWSADEHADHLTKCITDGDFSVFDEHGCFELVCGERRWRAARSLGLDTVPCVVRELSDKQAAMMCVAENEQREALSPLEGARGVQTLIDEGWEREEIAGHFGVELSWVCRRAKLLDLSETWVGLVEMVGSGVDEWSAYKLELVARYPVEVQERVAGGMYCEEPEYTRGLSFSDLRELFAQEMRVLGDAPWALDEELAGDEGLGRGTCEACTKRTDAQRELFDKAELAAVQGNGKKKGGPRCLDGECFHGKLRAFVRGRFHALGEKYRNLILVHVDDGTSFIPTDRLGPEMTFEDEDLVGKCKKGDEGARKCLVVGGSKAGLDFWGRLKNSLGDSEKDSPPPSLPPQGGGSEGDESAAFLHWKEEAGKVQVQLRAAREMDDRLLDDEMLVYGTRVFLDMEGTQGWRSDRSSDLWTVFNNYCREDDGSDVDSMKYIEKDLLIQFALWLDAAESYGDAAWLKREVEGICGACGFECEAFVAAEDAEAASA